VFDEIGAFKKQFKRVEGGYLVYPSRKVGGKFVSEEEYQHLVAGWERVAGPSGRWKFTGIIIAVIASWTLLGDAISLPEWANSVFTVAIVLAASTWLFWASTTPHRLVKHRPSLTLPRSTAEARREANATLNWPIVVFMLILNGAIFVGSISVTARSPGVWAWLIGSGAMLGGYIWIAFRKLTDRTR
jgi:hypothetical protein